jgi:hypothetical protein
VSLRTKRGERALPFVRRAIRRVGAWRTALQTGVARLPQLLFATTHNPRFLEHFDCRPIPCSNRNGMVLLARFSVNVPLSQMSGLVCASSMV